MWPWGSKIPQSAPRQSPRWLLRPPIILLARPATARSSSFYAVLHSPCTFGLVFWCTLNSSWKIPEFPARWVDRWLTICCSIGVTQLIGAPLYFVNKEMFYAYMAMTKRSFSLVITVMTRIWGRTTIRVSGDESVAGQIKKMPDGTVQFDFPERIVMIANHQVTMLS